MSNDATKIDSQVEETPSVDMQVETGEEEVLDEAMNLDDEDVESEDSLTFSNGVIEKIVALAMRDVPGVVGMKGGFINRVQDAFGVRDARRGVTVEVTPDSAVRVNIAVFIAYGSYAPQVFEDVKHAVVDAVTGMTGLEVAGVNLRIEDVLTPEEIEERSPKLPAAEETEELPEAEAEAEAAIEGAVDEAEEPVAE
ncbi:MAG: Asp23/Gls24 family envelope stress response protein [Atopobiaceae bacterium]|nr:Asp23/Gls24 family envelope stress response protein [Atopobiaceae bacterium]